MKKENKNLFENFMSLGALQVASYIIPFITLPYLSRVLGADKFGLVFFAFAFMQYFICLTDYGFILSATREIAVNRHNQNNLSNIFNSVNAIKIFLLAISFAILIFMIVFLPKFRQDYIVYLLSFIMVIGNAIYPNWFFQGMERMKYITFLNILAKMIFLVLIFVFVKKESDYIIVPLLNSLGFLISGMVGFYFAVKSFGLKLYIPKWNSVVRQFKYSTDFFLSRVSVALFTTTNTFFLGLIGSNVQVGYYVAAEKIFSALKNLYAPIKDSLVPYVAKYKNITMYKKIYKIVFGVNLLVGLFVFVFAKPIISIFYGADLLEAYKVLKVFAVGILVVCPSTMLGYPLLGAMGHTREANMAVIISSVFHIAGLFILFGLKMMNIVSIAILVVITESVLFSIWGYFVNKYKLLKIGGEYV